MNKAFVVFRRTAFLMAIPAAIWMASAGVVAEEKTFEFSDKLACDGVTVEVHSTCSEHAEMAIYSCTSQSISLDKNGQHIAKKNLLENEDFDDFHVATSLRCVATRDKHYVFIMLDNGGNCDGCEVGALMDLSGKWIFYGKRWLVSGAEKRQIRKSERTWLSAPYVMLADMSKQPDH